MSLKERSIAFIGAGHITEIIVSNLTNADNIIPRRLIASDPIQEKLEKLRNQYGISIAEDNQEAVDAADFVFINVLPNTVGEVVEEFNRLGFPQGKVIITVEDDGPGIDESVRDRLFDPFITTKAPGQGTGLGLSICYGIVKRYDGEIRVESKPGRGATTALPAPNFAPSFTVQVFLVAERADPRGSETNQYGHGPAVQNGLRKKHQGQKQQVVFQQSVERESIDRQQQPGRCQRARDRDNTAGQERVDEYVDEIVLWQKGS